MSKNNPENRGRVTELRKYGGKTVKPVLYINGKNRYIAAMYEDGNVVRDKATGLAIPYKNV
ncbi:MAG: hypothetical protein U1E36_00665 [Rickettsiales bacterium]